jgi:hypothetical protein
MPREERAHGAKAGMEASYALKEYDDNAACSSSVNTINGASGIS